MTRDKFFGIIVCGSSKRQAMAQPLYVLSVAIIFFFRYSESAIVSIGNPLLDISATGTKEFLEK